MRWWRNPFNQTRMELKRLKAGLMPGRNTAFNQTRMELKHHYQAPLVANLRSFNQTRMELKHTTVETALQELYLLIRPGWN